MIVKTNGFLNSVNKLDGQAIVFERKCGGKVGKCGDAVFANGEEKCQPGKTKCPPYVDAAGYLTSKVVKFLNGSKLKSGDFSKSEFASEEGGSKDSIRYSLSLVLDKNEKLSICAPNKACKKGAAYLFVEIDDIGRDKNVDAVVIKGGEDSNEPDFRLVHLRESSELTNKFGKFINWVTNNLFKNGLR